ncbi:hypothetical protein GPROT1_01917 [Gammaproteobacteria bacterium]|nr:hypothetical protein GPROT1_01917 [Gammaproteobacteria bacterium]
MKKASIILLGISLLCGCAASGGVTRTERGTFVVSAASSGISGEGEIKAASLGEARVFCEKGGRTLQVVNVRGSQPPYYLTNLPSITIEFMCSDRQGLDSAVSLR